MRCLVTGGAGFIGSALVRALLERGDAVRVLDNFSSGRRANLAEIEKEIEIMTGDLLDAAARQAALAGVECVFHLAAKVSVPQSLREPEADQRVNCGGTLGLLIDAAAQGIERLVYSSSAAIYGDNPELPLEENAAAAPLSPYGVSKYAGELYARMFHPGFGLATVALRYFNVYGPRQDPQSPYSGVLSRFLDCWAQGVEPTIYGDGEQTRDFVYAADVAAANLAAADAPAARVAGKAYNVGRGEAASLRQVIATLEAITGRRCSPQFEAARAGDIRHSRAEIKRARTELGWEPRWELEAGLRETLAWYRQAHP